MGDKKKHKKMITKQKLKKSLRPCLASFPKLAIKAFFSGNETQTSPPIQFFQIQNKRTFGFKSERASGSLRERSRTALTEEK